jgi:hypothetical protein
MDTPLDGLAEFTVSVYVVVGGGVVVDEPPPPQDAAARHKPAAEHSVNSLPKRFIRAPLAACFALAGNAFDSVRMRAAAYL